MAKLGDPPRESLDVLLVEDDPGDVVIAQEALRASKLDSRLSVVPDGVEALSYLRHEDGYADAARPETLRHFRTGIAADDKGPGPGGRFDPVTEADRAAERAMRAVLARERPEDGILGEEYGPQGGTSGLTWVLDPIDGTRGYISGTPTWGVLVSVADSEGPLYGLIDQPYIGERFTGGWGEATVAGPLGTARLRTAPPRPLAEAPGQSW